MIVDSKQTGGGLWKDLDLAKAKASSQDDRPLTWSTMLPLLADTFDEHAIDPLKLALICLDGLRNPDDALQIINAIDPNDRLANWLLYQVVLQADNPQQYEQLLRARPCWAEREESELAAMDNAVFQVLLGGAVEPVLDQALDWLHPGSAANLARQILLISLGEWDALAGSFHEQTPLAHLITAHLEGDRLGRVEEQFKELLAARDDEPLLTAETLLELSGGNDDSIVRSALEQRLRAINALGDEFLSAASATATLLRMRQPAHHARLEIPRLDNLHDAAAAWHQIAFLIERFDKATTTGPLTELYMEISERCLPPLSTALRIRTAELLMGQDRVADAFNLLPLVEDGDLYINLVWWYKMFCLARLHNWGLLSLELARHYVDQEERDERASLLYLALVVAIARLDKAEETLLVIESGLEHIPHKGALLLSGALLATHRRRENLHRMTGVWTDLTLRTHDYRQGSLAGFGAGVLLLAQGQPERAINSFKLASCHNPDDLLTEIGKILSLSHQGQWQEVVENLYKLADTTLDPAKSRLKILSARLMATKTGEPDRAMHIMSEISEQLNDDPVMLRETAEIQLMLEHYEEAQELLDRAVDLTPDTMERANMLRIRGDIYAERLNEPTLAEAAYRQAIDEHPLHLPTLDGLRRLLLEQKRYDELVTVLESMYTLVSDDRDRLNVMVDLSTVHYQLWMRTRTEKDAEACIRFCGLALELAPENKEAVKGLVQICSRMDKPQNLIGYLDIDAPTLLSSLRGLRIAFEETGQWPMLAIVCQKLAEKSNRPTESRDAGLNAGDIYFYKLKDLRAAEQCYRWVGERFPEAAPLQRLAEMMEQQGRTAEMAALMEKELKLVADEGRRYAILRKLGRIYAASRSCIPEARRYLTQATELVPMDVNTRHVLDTLPPPGPDEQYDLPERLPELIELMLDAAEKVSTMGDVTNCLLFAASASLEIKEEERALEIYRQVVARDPSSLRALEALTQLYGDHEEWEEQREVLKQRANLSKEPRQKATLLFQCGALSQHRLGSPEEAERFYRQAMDVMPTYPPALAALRDIYTQRNDYKSLAETLLKEFEGQRDRRRKAVILVELARLYETQRKDHNTALEYYKQAVKLHPECMEAVLSLFNFFRKRKRFVEAVEWGEIYARRAHLRGNQSAHADFLIRWADVLHEVGRVDEAKLNLEGALKLKPDKKAR